MSGYERYAARCVHWIGAEQRRCEARPTRKFIQGPKCVEHTPSALVDKPEPGTKAARGDAR